jgi:hypothetical protein
MHNTKVNFNLVIDFFIFLFSFVSFIWWFSGKGLFYSDSSPVLSPFTSLSLMGLSGVRLAAEKLVAWGKPMSLAILGIVSCGNASNILMLTLVPSLVLESLPWLVPTSVLTSVGLIFFCLYEVLILIRPSPKSYFIVDDILLHLALFPGGLSLLGHLLNSPTYLSSSADPRVGISLFEMAFMGAFAVSSLLSNKNLFLWHFLSRNLNNKIIFSMLFLNQFIAPTIVGLLYDTQNSPRALGLEFFVMVAGVLATLMFLILSAFYYWGKDENLSPQNN